MAHYVVGNPDCTFQRINNIFLNSAVLSQLTKDWAVFAGEMGMSHDDIETFRKQVNMGNQRTKDIFVPALTEWRTKKKSEATLGELIKILRRLNWQEIVELLEKEFRILEETLPPQRNAASSQVDSVSNTPRAHMQQMDEDEEEYLC